MSADSDKIIIRQLSMLGLDEAKNVDTFINITTQKLIEILKFLFSKFPDLGKIPAVPKSSALLYKYAASLIGIITKLGYPDSISYDAILYPSAEKTRSILSFILEKVPRNESDVAKSVTIATPLSQAIKSTQDDFVAAKKLKTRSYTEQPLKPISKETTPKEIEKISEISKLPKVSFISKPVLSDSGIAFNKQLGENSMTSLLAANDRDVSIDQFTINQEKSPRTKLFAIASRAFAASVATVEVVPVSTKQTTGISTKAHSRITNIARYEHHQQDTKIGTSAATATAAIATAATAAAATTAAASSQQTTEQQEQKKVEVAPKLTIAQAQKIRAAQQEELQATLDLIQKTEAQASAIEQQMEANKDELQRVNEILNTLKTENERLEQEATRAQKIAEIAQSDKTQIRAIQSELIDSTAALLDIARQFETRRAPLIEQYRSLATALRRRTDTYQMQMTKLAKLKRQIQEGEVKLRDDEEAITNLKGALENRGEQRPRSEYIDMIFQIIKTIEKQEQDVETIRVDIRAQHNQLNQTIEKVKRTWSLLDETIYSEAKRTQAEWVKKTYKIVVDLLTLFEGISVSVEESGKLSAQMMELDTKINRVETQVDTKALEKIENDLAEVKREIASRE